MITQDERIAALEAELAGSRFAAEQHLNTVKLQKTIIERMVAESSQPILSAVVASEDPMPKRTAFVKWCEGRGLDASEDKDSWGVRKFKHAHIQSMWEGWFHAPAALASAPAARPTAEKAGDLSNSRIIEIAYENGMKVRTGQGAIKFARAILASMSADAQSKGGA